MSETIQNLNLDDIDSSLIEETIEISADANPLAAPAPVDDGVHRVKLAVVENSWEGKETRPNKTTGNSQAYISCKVTGTVIAEGTKNNNKRLFENLNTLVFDGKSVMGYILLQVWGGKDNAQARHKLEQLKNYVDLAKEFKKILSSEPIVKVSTKWVARYNAGDKDDPDYKTALSGQKNFPMLKPGSPEAGFNHIVQVKNHGEASAQAVIQDYFPDK